MVAVTKTGCGYNCNFFIAYVRIGLPNQLFNVDTIVVGSYSIEIMQINDKMFGLNDLLK